MIAIIRPMDILVYSPDLEIEYCLQIRFYKYNKNTKLRSPKMSEINISISARIYVMRWEAHALGKQPM